MAEGYSSENRLAYYSCLTLDYYNVLQTDFHRIAVHVMLEHGYGKERQLCP